MIRINVFIPITHQINQEEIQNAHLMLNKRDQLHHKRSDLIIFLDEIRNLKMDRFFFSIFNQCDKMTLYDTIITNTIYLRDLNYP